MRTVGGMDGVLLDWLWQTTWQSAVLAGLILLAQLVFRKQLSPAWRYRLWLLLVVRLLIPAPPSSALSIFNLAGIEPVRTRLAAGTAAVSPSTLPLNTAAVENRWIATPGAVSPSNVSAAIGTGESESQSEDSARGSSARSAEFWSGIALRLWLVGACLVGLRLVWSDARFRSRLAGSVPVTNETVTRCSEECVRTVGIRGRVTLIETDQVDSPAVYGLWHKRLLLPDGIVERFSTGAKLELTLQRGDQTLTTIADEEEVGIFAPSPEINLSKP